MHPHHAITKLVDARLNVSEALKKQRASKLVSPIALMGLSACGGGEEDGGSHSGSDTDSGITIARISSIVIDHFQTPNDRFAVRNFFAQDLNMDGVQEVIVASFETQPNTPQDYSNTKLTILGWNGSQFDDQTPYFITSNERNVEAVGDIVFGDFNGDGSIDFFTSANADMDYEVGAYIFYGSGVEFNRELVEIESWQHGLAVGDINRDGFDDVFVARYGSESIYLGGAGGLLPANSFGYYAGGSGAVLGDFLNNGELQAVIVDGVGSGHADTILVSFEFLDRGIEISLVNVLPTPRLDHENFGSEISHDVRAFSLDFNTDGMLDVVVLSRGSYDDVSGEWTKISSVQFLKNNGAGNFEDVTDATISNYDSQSYIGYTPIIRDFDGDGFLDIFLSDGDFSGKNTSAVFLMGGEDGKFTEAGREFLSTVLSGNGGMATVVDGPNDDLFLLAGVQVMSNGAMQENFTLYSLDFL